MHQILLHKKKKKKKKKKKTVATRGCHPTCNIKKQINCIAYIEKKNM
jgi:hypothetical protein